jgi:hypothetical protein
MKEILHRQNSSTISRQVNPASLLDVFVGNCKAALVDESGMIGNQAGRIIDQKWSRYKGRLVLPPHSTNSNSTTQISRPSIKWYECRSHVGSSHCRHVMCWQENKKIKKMQWPLENHSAAAEYRGHGLIHTVSQSLRKVLSVGWSVWREAQSPAPKSVTSQSAAAKAQNPRCRTTVAYLDTGTERVGLRDTSLHGDQENEATSGQLTKRACLWHIAAAAVRNTKQYATRKCRQFSSGCVN